MVSGWAGGICPSAPGRTSQHRSLPWGRAAGGSPWRYRREEGGRTRGRAIDHDGWEEGDEEKEEEEEKEEHEE
eukprot:9493158-Pyramimonas_sp.AAC.1